MKKAIYAFSGDPITYGHIDIIREASKDYDKVIVGIGKNPEKKYTFSLEERTEMAQKVLASLPNVKVVSYKGLLAYYAKEQKIPVIIRGVRNKDDEVNEEILAKVNKNLGIDTRIYKADPALAHISSSIVKAMQIEHGPVHEYVPLYVKQCLEAKISEQYMIGITGEIGCGKSYISRKFEEFGKAANIQVHNIELDHIGHKILCKLKEPLYEEVREQITKIFGSKVRLPNGTIDRKILGEIVFSDKRDLERLNKIMAEPILIRFNREIYEKKGLILVNAALIAESNMSYLCNNNVVLVTADKESQRRRLEGKGFTAEQIERRLASQYNTKEKKEELEKRIEEDKQGKLWLIDNSDNSDPADIEKVFDDIVEELKVKNGSI